MTNTDPFDRIEQRVHLGLLKAIPDIHKLRDQFAIAAMQGELASQNPTSRDPEDFYSVGEEADLAWWSYHMADAMLEAKFK